METLLLSQHPARRIAGNAQANHHSYHPSPSRLLRLAPKSSSPRKKRTVSLSLSHPSLLIQSCHLKVVFFYVAERELSFL